jgi:hypothetical protein
MPPRPRRLRQAQLPGIVSRTSDDPNEVYAIAVSYANNHAANVPREEATIMGDPAPPHVGGVLTEDSLTDAAAQHAASSGARRGEVRLVRVCAEPAAAFLAADRTVMMGSQRTCR